MLYLRALPTYNYRTHKSPNYNSIFYNLLYLIPSFKGLRTHTISIYPRFVAIGGVVEDAGEPRSMSSKNHAGSNNYKL